MDFKDVKFDRNELAAVSIIFLLSIGIWQFPLKSTLPDFASATQLTGALKGASSPLYISVAAQVAEVLGVQPSPQAIVSFLLLFSPVLLALTSVVLYASLRALDFKKTVSAFSAVLFPLSLAALPFLPGAYSSIPLAAFLFSLFLYSFCYYAAKHSLIFLVPAAFFALASGYINPAFAAAGIGAVLSFAFSAYTKEKSRLPQFGLMALLFLAAFFLSPEKAQFSVSGIAQAFALLPFLLAAASCAVALYFFAQARADHLLLCLFGIIVSGFSPTAGAMLLVFAAAEGISRAADEKLPRTAKLACAFFIGFFAVFGIAYQLTDAYKGAMVGLLIGPIFPLLLYFYEYRNRELFFALGLGLFCLSLFTALLYQLPPQKEFYPSYADKDLSSALLSLSTSNAQSIGISERIDAVRFYAPAAGIIAGKDFDSYFETGKPVPQSGSFLVFSLKQIDQPATESPGFEAYFFVANTTSQGTRYAIFASSSGRAIARELSSSGAFALKDGSLIDSTGAVYTSVPLSRMLMLMPGKGFSDPENRLIVLDEGSGLPYFMNIYSGSAGELSHEGEFGNVDVYKVN
ncbi:Uncharacterised protein [uncultured archaeon]|nr:Uncharacterised protein [uncultured archaeon]